MEQSTSKLGDLKQLQRVTSPSSVGWRGSSADLTWVYLHGFSQLGTHLQWLRQLGYCGLSFHVVSSWLSSWHGDLRVPEGRKLQDLSWQRLESLIATFLLHSITQSKSEDLQFQEVAKSHCNWHIVIEGVINIFLYLGKHCGSFFDLCFFTLFLFNG